MGRSWSWILVSACVACGPGPAPETGSDSDAGTADASGGGSTSVATTSLETSDSSGSVSGDTSSTSAPPPPPPQCEDGQIYVVYVDDGGCPIETPPGVCKDIPPSCSGGPSCTCECTWDLCVTTGTCGLCFLGGFDCGNSASGGPCNPSPGLQDCPASYKCNFYDPCEDGVLRSATCVELSPDPKPVGAPCALGEAGYPEDDCVAGAVCWHLDATGTLGICVPACESGWKCDAGFTCVETHATVPPLCLTPCDPMAPSCGAGETCQPYGPDRTPLCLPSA